MKTIIRFGWLAPVLALFFGLRAAGQEASATGKVLIMANDRVLEGEITRVGDQYRIRRGSGETVIAADRAKRLCADWAGALAFLRSQANLGDPDERMRLARWCQQNGLKDDALVEARVALEMRPTHAATKQLLHVLQRATAAPATTPAAIRPPLSLPQLDLSADAVAAFNTRVQPILMNACANCHVSDPDSKFRLQRAGEIGARATTQFNLAAAVAQLKFEQPAASPLLVKAVSAHGGMSQPPLRDRKSVAMQTLQQWADQVAANNPHLHTASVPAAAVTPSSPDVPIALSPPNGFATAPKQVITRSVIRVNGPEGGAAIANAQAAALAQRNQAIPAPNSAALPSPGVVVNPNDPFDPAGFNRPK